MGICAENVVIHGPRLIDMLLPRVICVEVSYKVGTDGWEPTVVLTHSIGHPQKEGLFLHWLIEGAKKYYQKGLVVPAEESKRTARTNLKNDPVGAWLLVQNTQTETWTPCDICYANFWHFFSKFTPMKLQNKRPKSARLQELPCSSG